MTKQPKRQATNGSWRPGTSGNPAGRPRSGNALAEAVRARVNTAQLQVDLALELVTHGKTEQTRLAALTWLRDTGYNKPAERHEVVGVVASAQLDAAARARRAVDGCAARADLRRRATGSRARRSERSRRGIACRKPTYCATMPDALIPRRDVMRQRQRAAPFLQHARS